MGVAGFAGAGLAREDGGEGAGWVGISLRGWRTGGEAVQGGYYGCEVVEGVHAVGAAAKFAWGLWTTEDKKAEEGGFVAAKVEDGADAVLVLGDAGVVIRRRKAEVFEGMEGLADLIFFEVEDGIAAGALVAGVEECIES